MAVRNIGTATKHKPACVICTTPGTGQVGETKGDWNFPLSSSIISDGDLVRVVERFVELLSQAHRRVHRNGHGDVDVWDGLLALGHPPRDRLSHAGERKLAHPWGRRGRRRLRRRRTGRWGGATVRNCRASTGCCGLCQERLD